MCHLEAVVVWEMEGNNVYSHECPQPRTPGSGRLRSAWPVTVVENKPWGRGEEAGARSLAVIAALQETEAGLPSRGLEHLG